MVVPTTVKRWAFYNFANHSYQLVYVAYLLPVFFSTVLLARGYSLTAWGTANGAATLIGVALAVVLGRWADRHGKVRAFRTSIALSSAGMIAVALSAAYFPSYLLWLYIATSAVFIGSLSLSDSILPHLSDDSTAYAYGGFAWGFGYVGGIASLVVALVLQQLTGNYSLWVFASVPVFYILFSWYSLAGLWNVPFNAPHAPTPTLERPAIPTRQKVTLFLGYWLISECITVITLFASIYFSQEWNFTATEVGLLFLVVNLIAFPATWVGGVLAQKRDVLSLLGGTIILWGISIAALVAFDRNWLALCVGVLFIGLAYGNSQSYLRSQFSTLIRLRESGFQFGMYSIISEAAVVIGPPLYGFASDKLHSQKIPLIFLFLCMLMGYFLVLKIVRQIR